MREIQSFRNKDINPTIVSVAEKIESREAQEAWERIKPYLTEVSGLDSLSGHGRETKVRNYLEDEAKRFGYKTKIDTVGNLWLLSNAPEGEILLCAHMDKVGEPKKMEEAGNKIMGRLDDALGVSIIMGSLETGLRPSVLFTVEEEIGGAGASYATKNIYDAKEKRPKLALIIDVSALEKHGVGPLVYTSSGGKPFPKLPLKTIDKIVSENGLRVKLIRGFVNDSIFFARLPDQGVATLQVHVENMHSPKEIALVDDIKEVALVLEILIKNHEKLPELKPNALMSS